MTISTRTIGWNQFEKWLKVFVDGGEVFIEIDKGDSEDNASFVLTLNEWDEFKSGVDQLVSRSQAEGFK